MAATEIKLYETGDLFEVGDTPSKEEWNDRVLIKHQEEFERRAFLVYTWLQQLTTDDTTLETAIFNIFDVIVSGKRYYAESLEVDMTNLDIDTTYHVRFSIDDLDLHLDTYIDSIGELYIGTISKDSGGQTTITLCPTTIITTGTLATTIAIMPSEENSLNTPALLRYYDSAVEVSIDNGATWSQIGSGGGVTAHDALTHLDYTTAGHTGFQPAMGSDDNYVTDAEKTNLHAPGSDNQDLSALALKTNVLELDNTNAFTPTDDYHPATKKFVDDHIGGGVTAHQNLTNLDYDDSGHTGFEPARGADDKFVTTAELTTIHNTTNINSGDETLSSIMSKLGLTVLSGENRGDESTSTIKSKLGITTLSGSNTGDQIGDGVTITGAGTVADPFVATASGGGLVDEGTYNPSTTYSLNDLVYYNGIIYRWVNVTPGSGQTPVDGIYWNVFGIHTTVGNDKAIQFNDNGFPGADDKLKWDKTLAKMIVNGSATFYTTTESTLSGQAGVSIKNDFNIAGIPVGFVLEGNLQSSANHSMGLFQNTTLEPATNKHARFMQVGGVVNAVAGRTIQAYGLYIPAMVKTGTGTINYAYGIVMDAQTIGTKNYGLYQQGSAMFHYLEGYLSIGQTTPTYKLQITPTSGVTAGQTALIQDATATTGITTLDIKSGAGQTTSALQRWLDAGANVIASISETIFTVAATLKLKNGNKYNSFTNSAGQSDGTLAYTLPSALPTVNSVPLVSNAGVTTWQVLPQTAQASNTLLATTGPTNVCTLTPTALGNYTVGVYLRVVTDITNITVTVTYTDSGGAQANVILNVQPTPTGGYSCPQLFIESAASAITVTVTAGTANQVYVSASIKEL